MKRLDSAMPSSKCCPWGENYIELMTGNLVGDTWTMHEYKGIPVNKVSGWTEFTATLNVRHGTGADVTNCVYVGCGAAADSWIMADDFSIVTQSVPEPSAIVLVAMGMVSLLAYAWRKRK